MYKHWQECFRQWFTSMLLEKKSSTHIHMSKEGKSAIHLRTGRKKRRSNFPLSVTFINCNWVVTRWQWLFYMYLLTYSMEQSPS